MNSPPKKLPRLAFFQFFRARIYSKAPQASLRTEGKVLVYFSDQKKIEIFLGQENYF